MILRIRLLGTFMLSFGFLSANVFAGTFSSPDGVLTFELPDGWEPVDPAEPGVAVEARRGTSIFRITRLIRAQGRDQLVGKTRADAGRLRKQKAAIKRAGGRVELAGGVEFFFNDFLLGGNAFRAGYFNLRERSYALLAQNVTLKELNLFGRTLTAGAVERKRKTAERDSQNPCREEKIRLCGDGKPIKTGKCILRNFEKLSAACKEKINEGFERDHCLYDEWKFCEDGQGYGRGRCLRMHSDALSPACKRAREKGGVCWKGKEKFCAAISKGFRRTLCLIRHETELSAACRTQLDRKKPCLSDIERFCGDSAQRDVRRCLLSNIERLSPACRKASSQGGYRHPD